MNDPEHFIARWSRRKHQAANEADEATASSTSARSTPEAARVVRTADAAGKASADQPAQAGPPQPAFDLTRLPSLDTIAAGTDLRAFLAPGVPADLTRAALRRAWAADPAIRDFVGLAEYDWDFNTPGAAPGFGPLEMTEDLRQALTDMMGGRRKSGEPDGAVPVEQETASAIESAVDPVTGSPAAALANSSQQPGSSQDERVMSDEKLSACDELPRSAQAFAASQHSSQKVEIDQRIIGRPHGRALPK
jgi:hypothetical protein